MKNHIIVQMFTLYLPFLACIAPTYAQVLSSTCNLPPGDYCNGTAFNASLTNIYVCGDYRLGPVNFPTYIPLDTMLQTYNPFGGLCPGSFLEKYYNNTPGGGYIYPKQDGFQLNTKWKPIHGTINLIAGMLVDRFGNENGTFLSPASAPYIQRSLPPFNLDAPPDDPR